jgi:hypothetical protein
MNDQSFNRAMTSIREQRDALPEDLRQNCQGEALVRLVFQALNTVEEEEERFTGERWLLPPLPRVWLSVLTFSYGIGIYASDEIERQLRRDPGLRSLAGNVPLTSSDLRRCRRHHRALLQRTLTHLLRLCCMSPPSGHAVTRAQPEPDQEPFLDAAAQGRINQAIFADSMALDQ